MDVKMHGCYYMLCGWADYRPSRKLILLHKVIYLFYLLAFTFVSFLFVRRIDVDVDVDVDVVLKQAEA